METVIENISNIFKKSFYYLNLNTDPVITISQRPDLSDYQCNNAFTLAKILRENPKIIAEKIIKNIENNNIIENFSIDGPGFINIKIKDKFIIDYALNLLNLDTEIKDLIKNKKKTIIDFGSPNIAKPMHVGHLRTSFTGDCLQRLYKYLGIETLSVNHLGDWGTQIGMLIYALQEKYPEIKNYLENNNQNIEFKFDINELETLYPMMANRCKDNENDLKNSQIATKKLQDGSPNYVSLWNYIVKISKEQLEKDFNELDIHFDYWLGESYYNQYIPQLIDYLKTNNYVRESEGALVIFLDDLEKDLPPFLIMKSDGAYLYSTTDLTAIYVRTKIFNAKKILYVVDKRQSLHFKQLFLSARKSKLVDDNIELIHVAFGTINGPDGKPFKTRAGGVMRLNELIKTVKEKALERMKEADIAQNYDKNEKIDIATKVGISALKFSDLINYRESDYIFDIDNFVRFEGKTGPYILYTAVRIKSILKKAEELNIKSGELKIFSQIEREILLKIISLPDILLLTYEKSSPHYLCEFIYELSQLFNQFYNSCNIIRENDKIIQSSRITLLKIILKLYQIVLDILGIKIPEKM